MLSHPQFQPARPFLKWAGGKQRLLPQLLPLLPLRGRLIEPFVGAGSVFLAADYDRYLLNDANPDLIAVWVALKERPREFIEASATYFTPEYHSEQAYKRVRGEFNEATDRFERAVRFLYLNKFGFNGLFRVNKLGLHNVPYAWHKVLPLFPLAELEGAAAKLKLCTFLNGGFKAAVAEAGFGDVCYCDPPYASSTKGASFTAYTQAGFEWEDQQELVQVAEAAVQRGATVLVSNHDTPATRELYRGWEIHELAVRRSIGRSDSGRGMTRELVAVRRGCQASRSTA